MSRNNTRRNARKRKKNGDEPPDPFGTFPIEFPDEQRRLEWQFPINGTRRREYTVTLTDTDSQEVLWSTTIDYSNKSSLRHNPIGTGDSPEILLPYLPLIREHNGNPSLHNASDDMGRQIEIDTARQKRRPSYARA
ncbi:hypothetical protein CMI47_00340 [Candidatus Pacearchaeota archaeon]|nr:hypothetical protein [Candidatus Pacearchaeota archaeon]|tara:strand:- start:2869 stop:3276 length:408 start_codon:yes stop_codon:yes gene_type:complete